ncbi:MAG: outer membrane beta-barrel protein [Flavobacteriales bacterium]|jgi:outer membrane beta-barrel protein
MESWIQRIFLILSFAAATEALAQDTDAQDERTVLDSVINPDIERRRVDERKIDSENFEAGLYAGVMSVEDFGTNNVYGFRMAYHISEDFFLESAYGSTNTSKTSFETLSGAADLLTDDQRRLSYYNLSLGLNVLPGEVFIADKYAFNTSYYFITGAGNTQFAGDEFFTLNFGAGFRAMASDWFAFRVGFRNHLLTHSIFGEEKSIQNLEAHAGLSIYF